MSEWITAFMEQPATGHDVFVALVSGLSMGLSIATALLTAVRR